MRLEDEIQERHSPRSIDVLLGLRYDSNKHSPALVSLFSFIVFFAFRDPIRESKNARLVTPSCIAWYNRVEKAVSKLDRILAMRHDLVDSESAF